MYVSIIPCVCSFFQGVRVLGSRVFGLIAKMKSVERWLANAHSGFYGFIASDKEFAVELSSDKECCGDLDNVVIAFFCPMTYKSLS
jgi:hypothetical protein